MTFFGQASEATQSFNYPQETIENARKKIKEFPILHSIVGDFPNANKLNYSENHVLMLASAAVSSPFLEGQPDMSATHKLHQLEILLKYLLPELKNEPKQKLIARLKEFGQNNYATMMELGVYLELVRNPAISQLDYENSEKGNHDFFFLVDEQEVNMELTSLWKGEIQEILERAFEKAANKFLDVIPDNTMFIVQVVNDMLLKAKDNDSDEISEIIFESFKKIKPIVDVSKNNYFRWERNLGDDEKSLYSANVIYPYISHFGERLIELSKTNQGIDFLNGIKIKEVRRCPFSSFIIKDSKTKLVNIQSECMWPSKAELLRKEGLVKQIGNRLVDKMTNDQLKGKANPVIAFNFQDVLFHDYTSDQDHFGLEHLGELKKIVEDAFTKTKNNEILGVLLFDNVLSKSRFIKNPNMHDSEENRSKFALVSKIYTPIEATA